MKDLELGEEDETPTEDDEKLAAVKAGNCYLCGEKMSSKKCGHLIAEIDVTYQNFQGGSAQEIFNQFAQGFDERGEAIEEFIEKLYSAGFDYYRYESANDNCSAGDSETLYFWDGNPEMILKKLS